MIPLPLALVTICVDAGAALPERYEIRHRCSRAEPVFPKRDTSDCGCSLDRFGGGFVQVAIDALQRSSCPQALRDKS